jgi:DNA primase
VVVNYDPDSAGVAATERSLALLLEAGFEAKVLALPGGLDPDSFIRRQGAAAYRERLAAAPAYLDYLTERAMATHDQGTPEGKVAAANAVLPYVAKVPNPMLRAELANRLAERLRLDERLLRDELRRAAGEGRREIAVREEVAAAEANHAVKQLLRACLENPALADELLAELVENGVSTGLWGEGIFARLLELRRRGEKLDVTGWEEALSAEERRLVYESLFWPGDPLDRDRAQGYLRSLQIRKAQREREKLLAEIQEAARSQNSHKLVELQQAKLKLDKELRKLVQP